MKNFVSLFVFMVVILSFSYNNVFAQEVEGNIFVVTTFERSLSDEGSMAEFDSLNKLYTDNVLKKNDLILSVRTVNHLWGHNNRDLLVIYEVKNWADVEKANKLNNELFEKAWPTDEERKQYNKAVGKYYSGKHSDEIYQELKSGRK